MNWLKVLNLDGEGDERRAKLKIEGVIGGFDFFDDSGQTAAEFVRTVDALGDVSQIDIDLNSPGGVVSDGVAIANHLIHHPATVSINVIGQAASIASVILQAADPGQRHMALGTTVFVHDPLTIAIGDADDFRDIAETLDTVRDSIVGLFARHGTITQDDARELMRQDSTLTPEQALSSGIVDSMDETLQAVACWMDHTAALEQARKTISHTRSSLMPRNNPKTYNGPQLASLLNDAIDAIDNDDSDDRDRSAVVEEMGQQAGIDPSTVNSILNEGINCPPLRRLEGFAQVDGLPSLNAQQDAAESDGCEFGDDDDENRAQNCKPCARKPAPTIDVVKACNKANVPHLAESMIEAGLTIEQVRERTSSATSIRDICAAAGVDGRADRYIEAGMSADEVRRDLWDLVVARDGEHTDNHIPPDNRRALDTGEIYKHYNQQAQ